MDKAIKCFSLPRVAAFTIVFLLAGCFAHAQTSHAQVATGKLRGVVVDWQYARVLNTTVVFESESVKKVVCVDEDGAYEVELPVGTYSVKAESANFRPRHLNFSVEANTARTLNMLLDVVPMKFGKCPKGAICL